MRIHLWFPLVSAAALALAVGHAERARAGSFFGPSCYGARYTDKYPNRSHNSFGCGPGTHCQAWHPFFRHRLRKQQAAQAAGMMPAGMPGNMMPANMMPGNAMAGNTLPVEYMPAPVMPAPVMPAPVVQAPVIAAPVHTTAVTPAPVPAAPAVQSRIVPVPAPLPSGPVNPEPPIAEKGKPPF